MFDNIEFSDVVLLLTWLVLASQGGVLQNFRYMKDQKWLFPDFSGSGYA